MTQIKFTTLPDIAFDANLSAQFIDYVYASLLARSRQKKRPTLGGESDA